jgi:hypothetical protein
MKYIILGKSLKKGVSGNDSGDLSTYFELGWEVVGSRIDFIRLLKTENLSNCVAVTTDDRIFFYSKFFENVISYDQFQKVVTFEDIVDDWTSSKTSGNYFSFLYEETFVDSSGKYVYYEEDYDEIFNGFDFSNVSIKKPEKYVVIGLRTRDHSDQKNFTNYIDFYDKIIEKIKEEVTSNIFVVGFGTEKFCEKHQCKYVDKLVDFVYLIKDREKCIGQVTQSTGTLVLSLICSEVPIHLLDTNLVAQLNSKNAVLGGKCVHFCKGPIYHYAKSSLNDHDIVTIIKDLKLRR